MQYVRLGDTGLIVSRLAFGVMTFGTADPSSPFATVSKTPPQEAETLIGRSLDAGINFFHTADVYTNGETERILGEALGSRRKDVVISTEVGFRWVRRFSRPELLTAMCWRLRKGACAVCAPTT